MELRESIEKRELRRGFTTGSAATAAAKAATCMLFTGRPLSHIEIEIPAGEKLNLPLEEVEMLPSSVLCGVRKDGGDDPDMTHGLLIFARATRGKEGVHLQGGEGVGIVTSPGLPVGVGEVAINPVPREMIGRAVREVLPKGEGVVITIEVPRGREIARKTFNPRLGIEGGISILGTTGIVEPMSLSALQVSLSLKIDQALAMGYRDLVFVIGNRSYQKALDLGVLEERIIKTSNFVGFMLKEAKEKRIRSITLMGQLGKMVKIAVGIFNTHSKVADARLETIAAYTAALGGSQGLIQGILHSNTTEETIPLIEQEGLEGVFSYLARRIARKARELTEDKIEIGALLISYKGDRLGEYNLKEGDGESWRVNLDSM